MAAGGGSKLALGTFGVVLLGVIVSAACVGGPSSTIAAAVAVDGGPAGGFVPAPPDGRGPAPGLPSACSSRTPFAPFELMTINEPGVRQYAARFAPDGQTLYFQRDVPTGTAGFEIFRAARIEDSFSFRAATVLTRVNGAGSDATPSIGPGGRLVWEVERVEAGTTNSGGFDIWWADPAPDGFTNPRLLLEVSTAASERHPYVVADGHALYFTRQTSGSSAIMVSYWNGSAFGPPTSVAGLGTDGVDPVVRSDELVAYYKVEDPQTQRSDIFRATRRATVDPFGPGEPVSELNTTGDDSPTWVSEDDCTILFARSESGTSSKLWGGRRDLRR